MYILRYLHRQLQIFSFTNHFLLLSNLRIIQSLLYILTLYSFTYISPKSIQNTLSPLESKTTVSSDIIHFHSDNFLQSSHHFFNLSIRSVCPSRKSHMLFLMVCTFYNQFSSGVSVNCKMHFVLNGCINICYFSDRTFFHLHEFL